VTNNANDKRQQVRDATRSAFGVSAA